MEGRKEIKDVVDCDTVKKMGGKSERAKKKRMLAMGGIDFAAELMIMCKIAIGEVV